VFETRPLKKNVYIIHYASVDEGRLF